MGKLVNSSGEEIFVFPGSVGIDSLPEERLTVAGNISSTGNLSAGDIVGTWCGTTLSSSQVTVDSSDLKAYNVTEGLFLKSLGDGSVSWGSIPSSSASSTIGTIENTVTIQGDITATGDLHATNIFASNSFVSAGQDLLDIFATSSGNLEGSGTANTLTKFVDSSTVGDSIIRETGSRAIVGGSLSATGLLDVDGDTTILGNLSVHGDMHYIDTNVTVTSALSVVNSGTGPALYVQQKGSQPIAHFVDANGDDIVFSDNGYVGIGIPLATLAGGGTTPQERLTVSGNISALGALSATGSGDNYFAGKVGIGTVAPAEKLTVAGGISAMNGLSASGDVHIGSDGNVIFTGGATTDKIQSEASFLVLEGGNVILRKCGGGEDYAKFFGDGSVDLYYNNSKKFGTTNTGVGIFGNLSAASSICTAATTNGFVSAGRDLANIFSIGAAAIGGSGTVDYLPIWCGSTGLTNSILRQHSSGLSAFGGLSASGDVNYFAGKVGIGTNKPARDLSIVSSGANALLQIANCDTGSTSDNGLEIFMSSNSAGIVNRESGYLRFDTNNSERMRIASDGKVGIGATAPAEKLTVHGNISASGSLSAAGPDPNYFNGRVGIGTDTPSHKLNVAVSDGDDGIVLQKAGSSNDLFKFSMDGTNDKAELFQYSLGNTIFAVRPTNVGYINTGQNFGIGTASPNEQLTVAGNISALGALSATGGVHVPDSACITAGNHKDLQIYHDGSNSYIRDESGTGDIIVSTNAYRLKSANNGETMMTAFEDGAVNLYHNNISRFSTTDSGVCVVGGLSASATTNGFVSAGRDLADIFGHNTNPIDGSGTACHLAVWSDTDTLTNSIACQNSSCLTVCGAAYILNGLSATGASYKNYFAGNVGIGAQNPAEKLTVAGGISAMHGLSAHMPVLIEGGNGAQVCVLAGNTAWDAGIDLDTGGGNGQWRVKAEGSDESFRVSNVDQGGTSALTVTYDGCVGIKTTVPAERLSVMGNISACGSFCAGTGYSYLGDRVAIGCDLSPGYGLSMPDDCVIGLGGSGDLRIQHTSNQSYISNYTGPLYIDNNATDQDIILRADDVNGNAVSYLSLDGGNEQVYISTGLPASAGEVGIGTTSPAEKLHVCSSTGNITTKIEVGGSGNANLQLKNNAGDRIIRATSDKLWFVDNTDGRTDMVIDGAGNVGIAVNDPDEKLEVDGNIKIGADKWYRMGGNAFQIGVDGANGGMHFHAGSSEKMTLSANGYLGIGTTAPAEKLTVHGNISASGSLSAAGPNNNYFAGNVGIGTNAAEEKLKVCAGTVKIDSGYNFQIDTCACIGHHYNNFRICNNIGDIIIENDGALKDVIFCTDAGSKAETMRLSATGQLGVGTAAPREKLTVHGNISASGSLSAAGPNNNYFAGNVGIGTIAPTKELEVSSGGADSPTIKASYNPTNYLEIGHNRINAVSSGGNDSIFFQTAGTCRMSINNSGQFAMNATSFPADSNLSVKAIASNQGVVFGENAYPTSLGTNGLSIEGGLRVASTLSAVSGVNVPDSSKITLGNNRDLQIFHDVSYSQINANGTGHLYITQTTADADIRFQADNGSGTPTTYFYLDGGGVNTCVEKNFRFADNVRTEFGSSSNLRICHTGSLGILTNNTGHLYLQNSADNSDIYIQSDDGYGSTVNYIVADGGNEQVYISTGLPASAGEVGIGTTAPAEKLTVHGNISASGSLSASSGYSYLGDRVSIGCSIIPGYGLSMPDSCKIGLGNSGGLQIYHDGNNKIEGITGYTRLAATNGSLYLDGNNTHIRSGDGGETQAKFIDNGAVELYYDNSKKLVTASGSVDVTGMLCTTDNIRAENSSFMGGREDASAPTYRFHDDGDTGMFNVASDILAFSTGGTEQMRISSNGYVGIGTTAPEAPLHILGAYDVNNPKTLVVAGRENASLTKGAIQFERAGGGTFMGIGNDSRADRDEIYIGGGPGGVKAATAFRVYTEGPVGSTAGYERLTILSGGCVGIGTSAPAEKLTVAGNISASGNGYFACVIAGGYFEEKAASPTLAEYPTGSLVVIGCGGNLELSTKSNDKNVFGVTKNGVCQPIVLGAEPVLVTGDINVGDFITTSDTPGHGKKSIDSVHGSIIAQAMAAGCGCSYTLQAMIRKM